jgi:hypothetical protein
MRTHSLIDSRAVPATERARRTRAFVRHALEMTAAMMLGMAVLGAAFGAIHVAVFGSGFDRAWREHTELAVFAMTFNMTVPMVAWMRHRGHGWKATGEMGGAMFGIAFALLMLFWLGAVPAQMVLPLEMALMLPAMIAVMAVRRDEYAGPRHT